MSPSLAKKVQRASLPHWARQEEWGSEGKKAVNAIYVYEHCMFPLYFSVLLSCFLIWNPCSVIKVTEWVSLIFCVTQRKSPATLIWDVWSLWISGTVRLLSKTIFAWETVNISHCTAGPIPKISPRLFHNLSFISDNPKLYTIIQALHVSIGDAKRLVPVPSKPSRPRPYFRMSARTSCLVKPTVTHCFC